MQHSVDDTFVGHLVGISTLEYLGLGSTRLTDASLAHAARKPKLMALEKNGVVGLSDGGLAHLASHPTLAALRLEGARGITDAGALHLASIPTGEWDGWLHVYPREDQDPQGQKRGNGQTRRFNGGGNGQGQQHQTPADFDDDIPF